MHLAAGPLPRYYVGKLTRDAARGDTRLWLDRASGVAAGEQLLVTLDNPPDGSLDAALADYRFDASKGFPDPEKLPAEDGLVRFMVRATAIDASGLVHIDRPLPIDAKRAWRARVWTTGGFRRTLCGVEHLTMALPHSEWPGVGRTVGYNLLGFASVQNSWVTGGRDCKSSSGDSCGSGRSRSTLLLYWLCGLGRKR